MTHDLTARRRKCFGGPNHAECSSNRREQQRKQPKRNNLKRWAGFDKKVKCNDQAEQEREAIKKVCGKGGGPHWRAVHARDFDLAVGEFNKICEVCLYVGEREALGKENDLAAGSFDGHGEGVVVAEGRLPNFEHTHLVKNSAPDGRAAAPAEIFRLATQHGNDRGVPSGKKDGRQGIVVGDEPAHGGGRTDAGVVERSDHVMQPGFARAAVGIGEDQDFKFRRELFDAHAKIVDLFATICGLAGDDHVGLHPRGSGDPFDGRVSGVLFGSQDEEDFVVLMVEFTEGYEIPLEARFHAAARAEHGGARRIETRVGMQAQAHVEEPLKPLPEQEDASNNLSDGQKCE